MGNKSVERNGMISIHRMTEQHRDNWGYGTGLIKRNGMKLYLNKKNYFLALTVGIGTACKECKLVCISFRGNHARESHWNLSNTQKHLTLENFWWENMKKAAGNTMCVCAAPVLSCLLLHLCFLSALKVLVTSLSSCRVFLSEFS